MKKKMILAIAAACLAAAGGCSPKTAEWNGETEYYAHVAMAVDETDPYACVGAADYVFAGTVTDVVSNVIPDEPDGSDADLSVYDIQVTQNIKGELVQNVTCSKHGGFKKDGTMMLLFSDNRQDSGLPEEGKSYIFMAYVQPDGSLTLSEFFDNREYSEELLLEYTEYCQNEKPFERERFVSDFDAGRDGAS